MRKVNAGKHKSEILSLGMLGLLGACGPLTPVLVEDAIIGGREVQVGEDISRRTVALTMERVDGKQSHCSGALLGPHLVLTAAHCVDPDLGMLSTRVHVGTNLQDSEGFAVVDQKIHPGYFENRLLEQKLADDLALLYIQGPLPAWAEFNEIVEGPLGVGTQVEVAGYGATSDDPARLNKEDWDGGRLRVAVGVPVWRTFEKDFLLDQSGRDFAGKGLCYGDSGGPVFWRDPQGQLKLWGLSSGVLLGSLGEPNCEGLAKVSDLRAYSEWLAETSRHLGLGRGDLASASTRELP